MADDFLSESLAAYRNYKYNPQASNNLLENINFTNAPDFIKDLTTMNQKNTAAASSAKTPLYKSPSFLKGVLLGAGLAYIATNKTVQQAVISASVRMFASVQGSFEEMKEQIQDIKAEISSEE